MSELARTRGLPRPEELLPLSERVGALRLLRAGLAAVVLLSPLVLGSPSGAFASTLPLPTAGYLALVTAVDALQRRERGPRLWLLGAMLLLDGLYLTWATYATGGLGSPLRFLVLVHVVAVTLLASYRTGLKLAGWYTLLLLAASYAQAAGILETREALAGTLPGGSEFGRLATAGLAAIWVVAFATAAFAAASERELRRQKVDLAELAATTAEIQACGEVRAIPRILLDRLVDLFGFARAVLLASPEGDLEVLAHRGIAEPEAAPSGLDATVEAAWSTRRPQLLRALDPEQDPLLAALLPDARNVLVVPLFLEGERRVGALVLEHPASHGGIRRWVLDVIQQFAGHAALALHNAWLLEELRERLEENRALQQQLVSQNLELEMRVQERTRELEERLEDLRRVDRQRRRLLSRLVEASEAERRELAGDIHDDPVQKMVAVNMRLQMLRNALADPEQREVVQGLVEVVRTSIGSLRNLLFELRPSVLDDEGLAPALIAYLEHMDEELGFDVDNRLAAEPPAETRVILYRIAQEALANVRKHAEASRVEVLLAERDGGFCVRISDDGVGFAAAEVDRGVPGHLGLASMRERAELAGGRCDIHTLPGGGTTVECWLPGDGPGRGGASRKARVQDPGPVDIVA